MPDDQTKQPRRGWRVKEAGAAKPAFRQPQWRGGETTHAAATPSVAGRLRLRTVKVLLGVLAFATLLGVLIWALFMIWLPRPVGVVLLGARYAENLAVPHNVYGWHGLTNFAAFTRVHNQDFWNGSQFRLHGDPREVRSAADWDKDLDRADESSLLLVMSMDGGVDREGAYLLPQQADPRGDGTDRLRVTAILDRLATLPARRRKILVLDATQLTANWGLGMLGNDFVRELDALNDRIAQVPNLIVLNATDADQRSWVSPEWGRTIFLHTLVEGLRGAADANHDGRITGLELANYVTNFVERWVAANRDARQTPVLYPRGDAGTSRARALDVVLVKKYTPPNPYDIPPFAPPPALMEAWKSCQRLRDMVPGPEVYTPQHWRRYQDTLLRYEQLIEAGDAEAATTLGNVLVDLERDILRARRLQLASTQNTLTMLTVAGLSLVRDEAVLRTFNDLWEAPTAELTKRWAALLAGVPERGKQQQLRVQLWGLLLERAADQIGTALDKACELVRLLDDPVAPRPAEAQFLILLQRDRLRGAAATRPYYDLLQLAVQVRLLAEQAALAVRHDAFAYSESVFPWIKDQLEEGDAKRRLGLDLVFASDPDAWKKGTEALGAARTIYQAVLKRGGIVRAAFLERDRAFAVLPYIAAAGALLEADDEANALLRQIENAWRDAHRLSKSLETPNPAALETAPPPTADEPQPLSLAAASAGMTTALRELREVANHTMVSLTDSDVPGSWRNIENVLVLPTIEPDLRMKLLINKYRVSNRLLIETAQRIPVDAVVSPEKNQDLAKQEAYHQGRMALAVLGPRWFDECPRPARGVLEQFVEVRYRLNTFAVDDKWWKSLQQAGEQIGYRVRQLPPTINALLDTISNAPAEEAGALLPKAARLSRLVDGAGSLRLSGSPVTEFRHAMVHLLMLAQTRRTLDDHWFGESRTAPPYYQTAAGLFLDDAALLSMRQDANPRVKALRLEVARPGTLGFTGPGVLHITSEQQFGADYQLRSDPNAVVPPGTPVVWAEPGPALKLLAPAVGQRVVRPFTPKTLPDLLHCLVSSPLIAEAETNPPRLPLPEPSTLTVRGLYRGQQIELLTKLDVHPLPEMARLVPPLPDKGSLAVRASPELHDRFGAANGALAIVLDCSGSMGPPEGQPYTPSTKFNEATRAVRAMLRGLPKGVTVSLWVFGQAMGDRNTVTDVERTVTRLQAPVHWDSDNPAQLGALMAKVNYPALVPWNQSPIMHAILEAKKDLKDAAGFKTLLVITDGMDNRFENDHEFNPKKHDIPTALREAFADSGIEVNIVGFKVENAEEATARKQFEPIKELPVPGKFYTVNDVVELTTLLGQVMRQRLRYWIETEANVPVDGLPANGLEISRSGANDQWFLPGLTPRFYQVRARTDQLVDRRVAIDPGALVLARLAALATGTQLERLLWGPTDFPTRPAKEVSGWRLTNLQNQTLGDQSLHLLNTLEKLVDPRETQLQQLRPRQAWVEVRPPATVQASFAQRWSFLPGYPGPAWGTSVPLWPSIPGGGGQLAAPRVRVWWNPDQETPIASSLDRGRDFTTLADLTNRAVQVEGDAVTLESVQVEQHLVEIRPGVRAPRSCLVVRMAHPLGKAVWVEARGVPAVGAEHRWYDSVGKYTGLFWPVTRAEAEGTLSRLSVISLVAFQRDCAGRGYFLELADLPTPTPGDVRPEPPVPLPYR